MLEMVSLGDSGDEDVWIYRPKYLHEYKLTPHSLLSAVSINLVSVGRGLTVNG